MKEQLGQMSAPLIGRQDCALDEKRRFSLPPKFRYAFPAEVTRASGHLYPAVIVPWFKGGLAVLPEPAWAEVEGGLNLMDFTEEEADGCLLMVLSRAEHMTTDPEGRLTLTPEQCEWIRVEPGSRSKLVAVGRGKMVMVFNADEWPHVMATGSNPAAQGNDAKAYESALKQLLGWVRDEKDRAVQSAGSFDRARGDGDGVPGLGGSGAETPDGD